MPLAELQHDGGQACHRAILSAAKNLLPDHIPAENGHDERQSVIGIMASILNRLSQIKDERMRLHVRGASETKDLVGYEFVDIAGFEEYMHAKRVAIGKNGAGWMQFVAKRPEMAILVCSNLKDPIRLATGETTCASWTEVPKDQYYLAATMPCLKYLSRRCGGEDSLKLYNQIYCTPPTGGIHTELCNMAEWPCCTPLFQISDHPSKQPLRFDDFSTLVIGKPPVDKLHLSMSAPFKLMHISTPKDATPEDPRPLKRRLSGSCQTSTVPTPNKRVKLHLAPTELDSESASVLPVAASSDTVRGGRINSLFHLGGEHRQWLTHTTK